MERKASNLTMSPWARRLGLVKMRESLHHQPFSLSQLTFIPGRFYTSHHDFIGAVLSAPHFQQGGVRPS
jgi:hypothetical protein